MTEEGWCPTVAFQVYRAYGCRTAYVRGGRTRAGRGTPFLSTPCAQLHMDTGLLVPVCAWAGLGSLLQENPGCHYACDHTYSDHNV